MDLIACLFPPQSAWSHIEKLIERGEWKNIVLVADRESARRFQEKKLGKKPHIIIIDEERPAVDIIRELTASLKGNTTDFEVGLNMVSGSGKEHMCVLAAVLKLGVGIRLVALTKEGVKDL